jgi:hypothetical protein
LLAGSYSSSHDTRQERNSVTDVTTHTYAAPTDYALRRPDAVQYCSDLKIILLMAHTSAADVVSLSRAASSTALMVIVE